MYLFLDPQMIKAFIATLFCNNAKLWSIYFGWTRDTCIYISYIMYKHSVALIKSESDIKRTRHCCLYLNITSEFQPKMLNLFEIYKKKKQIIYNCLTAIVKRLVYYAQSAYYVFYTIFICIAPIHDGNKLITLTCPPRSLSKIIHSTAVRYRLYNESEFNPPNCQPAKPINYTVCTALLCALPFGSIRLSSCTAGNWL